MKTMNFVVAALAGLGLVTSQVAFADTLPGSAVPVAGEHHAHPVKLVRLSEKRHDASSDAAGGISPVGIIIGLAALGAIIFGAIKVSEKSV